MAGCTRKAQQLELGRLPLGYKKVTRLLRPTLSRQFTRQVYRLQNFQRHEILDLWKT